MLNIFISLILTSHAGFWGTVGKELASPVTTDAKYYTMAGFVAWSRINDNAHRLHDVVGGAVVGLSYGLSLHYLYKDENSEIAKVSLIPIRDGLMLGYRTDF